MLWQSAVASKDGKLLAYGLADGGSDWRTWKVRDVDSGKDLDDLVQWVKFSNIAWMPDGSGFFYGRYAEPQEGQELTGTNENQRMFFHRIETRNPKISSYWRRPDHPKWGFSPAVTDDGRYLIIQNWKGVSPSRRYSSRICKRSDSQVEPLITGFDAEYGGSFRW